MQCAWTVFYAVFFVQEKFSELRYLASEAAKPPSELRWGSGGAAPGKFSEFLDAQRPGEAIWYLLLYVHLYRYKIIKITIWLKIEGL